MLILFVHRWGYKKKNSSSFGTLFSLISVVDNQYVVPEKSKYFFFANLGILTPFLKGETSPVQGS